MAVIDASALIEILQNTPRAAKIGERVAASNEAVHAPSLIDLEIAQVLRRQVRRGDLSPGRAQQVLDDLVAFPLIRCAHEFLLPRIWQLRDSMTAYDASYVALAEMLEETLLTCDAKLARSQRHDAAIELLA